MQQSKNLVVLIGNVGKDAEVKKDSFTTFPIATTEKYKDKSGNKQTKTEWHNVIVNNTKIAQYIKKGDLLSVMGSISSTKKDDKVFVNIRANDVQFLKSNNDQGQNQTSGNPVEEGNKNFDKEKGKDSIPDDGGDDLPF